MADLILQDWHLTGSRNNYSEKYKSTTMIKGNLWRGLLSSLVILVLINGCRKKDAPLPDNTVQFESTQQGIAEAVTSVTFKLKLDRATTADIPVSINVTNSGVAYTTDYTTVPAKTASDVIPVTILSGSSEASFTVNKTAGALNDGTGKIVFKIASSGSPVIIGTTNELTLSFSEIVAKAGGYIIDGGGTNYGNKVFIDLAGNKQTPVLRTKWDLGFFTDPSDFRVILNSSSAMMAKQINKNDLNAVTAADTAGFSTDVIFDQLDPKVTAFGYIDYPTGDITKTAIAQISSTAPDNKVYIINRGTGVGTPAPARGWKKIRVIRNASGGYTLQHADIGATTFQEIQIAKDDKYFFKYISFETGAVDVEPEKKKWDLAWTYFSNMTDFGGGFVPYLFQDIIIQNRNVQTVQVLTSAKTYEAFAEADIAALTFSSVQTNIGSNWRSGGGPTSSPSIRSDRFYVIKDSDNNYYKLKFTALLDAGVRGRPAFEYALVKRGG